MPYFPPPSAGSSGGGQTTFTKVVAPTGGDYTTLGAALAAAADGWSIKIMPGTYTESADISNSFNNVTVIGSGKASTILNFSTHTFLNFGTYLTLEDFQMNFTTGGFGNFVDYAAIDSISWTKSGSSNDGFAFNGQYCRLTNSELISTNSTTSGSFLVFNSGGNNAFIANNHFQVDTVFTGGGSVRFSGTGQICDNKFENNGAHANPLVDLVGSKYVFTGNYIEDLVGSQALTALILNNVWNVVTGNQILNFALGIGIDINTSTNSSYENTIAGNILISNKNGIKLTGSPPRNTITSNVIIGVGTANSSNGINATGDNNVISSNEVKNFQTGINIASGTKDAVTGNIALNNGTNFNDSGTTTSSTGNITA